jgi:hypothetical protein
MSDATAVTCPHCGRLSCGVRNGATHAAACPHNPDVAARIRAALENPDRPGWAFGGVIYARRARECGAQSTKNAEKPISLAPLSEAQALRGLLSVKPMKSNELKKASKKQTAKKGQAK